MDVALINGLFVRMVGPQTGRSLILLHALADSSLAFEPLFDTPLADRFAWSLSISLASAHHRGKSMCVGWPNMQKR